MSRLAVYVHWPFCQSKCPYCDFNSHVREQVDQAGWRHALLADLAHEAANTPGQTVGSLFFGGGTPSLMEPATVAALIDAVHRHWPVADGLEITLEANPGSVEAGRFADFAAAGVNRVSLGLQALDDAALQFLGRRHSVAEGLAALDLARRLFPRVSFDLIYARPGQTAAAWEAELTRALAFGTGHLSLYQLTIEPGTAFAEQHRRQRFTLPDEDLAADLFLLTGALTDAHGLARYETSNHARPGEESRHNLAYWHYDTYVGVGPGAHGRRAGCATQRLKRPEDWRKSVAAQGHGLESTMPLGPRARAEEALLMGLRLTRGIDRARFAANTGTALDAVIDPDACRRLCAQGLLHADARTLRATPQGQLVLNALLGALIAAG